ncbi:MAG TPA: hypothetical protein VII92_18045, partial [Anaerolineae bacterium]
MTGQQAGMGKQVKVMLMAVRGLAAGYLWTTVAISVVIGLLLGWFVLGWWLAPVGWTDARPFRLSSSEGFIPYRQYYLQFAADAYANPNAALPIAEVARRLGVNDGWSAQDVVDEISRIQPGNDRLAALRSALVKQFNLSGTGGVPATQASGISPVVVIGVLIIIGACVALVWIIQRRSRAAADAVMSGMAVSSQAASGDTTEQVTQQVVTVAPPVSRAQGAPHPVQKTAWAGEATPPLAQYVTSYAHGDDRYDVSFSIETSTGDFLGECGVGISELIGTGSPDKVTALEVWLFDKNDIRTLTKVFMSENAYNDQALRAKLAPKGEAVLVKKGEISALTTQTLKVN